MEATTVKTEFGALRDNYRSKKEFIAALEAEYHINQIDGNYVFSKMERVFMVLDWFEFCDNKPNQKKNYFFDRDHQKESETERAFRKLPIVYAT